MSNVKSYNGINQYAFISYSHINSEAVLKILSEFQNLGINFWFDEGIIPGEDYTEKIAKKINDSSYFFAFLSNTYFKSDYCKKELNFALRKNIPIVCICLEDDINIPIGFDMELCQNQLVYMNKFNSHSEMLSSIVTNLPKDILGEKGITLWRANNNFRIYIRTSEVADGDMEVLHIILEDRALEKEKVLFMINKGLFSNLSFSVSPNMSPLSKGILSYGDVKQQTFNYQYYLSIYSQVFMGSRAGQSCFELYSLEVFYDKLENIKDISDVDHLLEIHIMKRYNSYETVEFYPNINYGIVYLNRTSVDSNNFPSLTNKYPYEDMKLEVNFANNEKKYYIVKNGIPHIYES